MIKNFIKQGTLLANQEVQILDSNEYGNCTIKNIKLTNKNNAIILYKYKITQNNDNSSFYRVYNEQLFEYMSTSLTCKPVSLVKEGNNTQQIWLYSDTDNVDYSIDIEVL